jgi:hypothetical protein
VELVQHEQGELQILVPDNIGRVRDNVLSNLEQSFCMRIARQDTHNLLAERPTSGWHLHRTVRDDPGLREGSRHDSNVPENHEGESSKAIAVTIDAVLIE